MKACLLGTVGIVGVAFSLAGGLAAQTPAKPLAFEVASVKVNRSASDVSVNSGATPGRFTITNVPLRFIMLYAFHLLDHQLAATPAWASSTGYDINATYPPGITPSEDDARGMVQTLLKDRFGLVFHHETRELPAYELTLARKDGKLGSQLVRSDVDCVQWRANGCPLAGAGGHSRVAPGREAASVQLGR